VAAHHGSAPRAERSRKRADDDPSACGVEFRGYGTLDGRGGHFERPRRCIDSGSGRVGSVAFSWGAASGAARRRPGVVFACKTAGGDSLKGNDCGSLSGLDAVLMPRLRKVADCPEASGVAGKLHLVTRVDFARGSLGVELGRNQGVPSPEPLLACAKSSLEDAKLSGIGHENPRYSVAYTLTFGDEKASPAGSASHEAAPDGPEGTALVTWDVAIVRDAPRTGKVVVRLQRGTAVRIGAAKDGWYPIKYGDGFASEGWVYRGAIGK
jgi:hypothetical protein